MTNRNIVLLSDGTGNSAGKISKTNIWRIYETIDLTEGDQLAFFDDGVGSGGWQLTRILGGVFGFGLARNVRELYENLCRHYRGEEDRIFLFGFSRGAFTVRVLSGLIEHCGVIDRTSDKTVRIWRWSRMRHEEVPISTDEGLKAAIRLAYRSLRKRNDKAFVSKVLRRVRDRFFVRTLKTDEFCKRYSVSQTPKIAFLGVFDTVSAYGLPFDEMTVAIHKLLFPLRFPNNELLSSVTHAYQALALDEARHTFHPELWTERKRGIDGGKVEADRRPQQVWFAGVHSDIGGGYSNERLSLVPAIWMLNQATDVAGLRLRKSAMDNLVERASAVGEIHDSRRGLSAVYRLKPRILTLLGREDLDGDNENEVWLDRFKIHQSVFERVKHTNADYAPVGVPAEYDVVLDRKDENGKTIYETVQETAAGYETDAERGQRAVLQRATLDIIFLRQLAHLLMVGIALLVVALPFWRLADPARISEGLSAQIVGIFAWAIALLPVPETQRIGQFWVRNAPGFLGLAGLFALIYLVSGNLTRATQARAQKAWAHVSGGKLSAVSPRKQWIEIWRTHNKTFHKKWTKKIFPRLALIALLLLPAGIAAWRWYIFTPYEGKSVCTYLPAATGQETKTRLGETVSFETRDQCFDTGFELAEGFQYRISLEVKQPWTDHDIPATPIALSWDEMKWETYFYMRLLVFTRRFWGADWFAMIGSIGRAREYAFTISARYGGASAGTYDYTFRAWRSGRLFLFVNDAILPWRDLYDNNHGTAQITVTEERAF